MRLPPTTTSPWPSIGRRSRALLSEVYAELVGEAIALVQRGAPPTPPPGVPTFGTRLSNSLVSLVALVVAGIGGVERLVLGTDGLPVNEIREATLAELKLGAGRLPDKRLLPSAYEVWDGPREAGMLRLRYAYDAERLAGLLEPTAGDAAEAICTPLVLDRGATEWVRARVERPAPASRLHVWRALKRRLYHYDAGVVAFKGFPRNYMMSEAQWAELLHGLPMERGGVALDIGAGDGSLNMPMRQLFTRLVATELTVPLVCRLRSLGLDATVANEPSPAALGADLASFDAVLILNVLDRCKDPFAMLEQARSLLAPEGYLVVSVVLPASQSDAAATVGSKQRQWAVSGHDFESAAASLVRDLLVPAGFEARRIARIPYLCAGDRFSPVAALDACVVVLRHARGAGGAPLGCVECVEQPDGGAGSATTPLLS